MDHNLLLLIAAPLLGFIAGFINTLAGSGSLITLPLLILLGLPANEANATNRVGVVVQNIVAISAFRRRGVLRLRGTGRILLPAVIGSVIGAQLAADLDEELLRRTIGALMLVMLFVVLLKPRRWIEAHADNADGYRWWHALIFFGLGIYGGFIQAGVGIFLLAALVLGAGYNLLGANVLKNVIVLLLGAASLIVFMVYDQVVWSLGLLLASGQAAGAWVAVHMAVTRGAEFLRWLLIVILLVSGAALIFDVSI
jgi:uncharacterized protein